MKKLFTLLLLTTMLISCSSDDDNDQDYTSFVFEQTANVDLPNCVAGYKKDGKYIKLGNLGDLSKDKQSTEIRVNDNSIKDIYFFTDYNGVVRLDYVFSLISNKKNTFKLTNGMKGIGVADKTDPTQYPQ